ncbi:hypothetical protein [Janthinobacterium aquaticum]|uniref:hypothetical protein n=1 Tax=Janthinobacterium sp. FT58W TaxID=2654254 RepID=UPI001264875C|nr:hypothetical protein [Janthinobacterium sp. FT58W]KAB8043468.1 hypothetical protein GCM43_09155 [Janthinobacterium sp. FT58W]
MTTQPFDHGIPLLTEVLSEREELAAEIPASKPDTTKPGMFQIQPDGEMPGSDPEGPPSGFAVGVETNTHPAPSPVAIEPDWEAIEARLTQRILHQVQGKIDHLLEERIAHVLQTALQNALIGMRGALREDLQQSLEQIVAHAVSHELGHLHPPQH